VEVGGDGGSRFADEVYMLQIGRLYMTWSGQRLSLYM